MRLLDACRWCSDRLAGGNKRFWQLRAPLREEDGFYGNVDVKQYMEWAAIASYLHCYEYVQPDGKAEKKNSDKVSSGMLVQMTMMGIVCGRKNRAREIRSRLGRYRRRI